MKTFVLKNENLNTNDLERDLFETRKKIEKIAKKSKGGIADYYEDIL